MLVDPPLKQVFDDSQWISRMIAKTRLEGGEHEVDIFHPEMVRKIATGIYQCLHWGFDYEITVPLTFKEQYPEFAPLDDGDPFPPYSNYGVCDDYRQVLRIYREVVESPDRSFFISITPVYKADQPDSGGWRWHKWGAYIGDGKPEHEYLYDEPDGSFDVVYCYHIYEMPKNEDV